MKKTILLFLILISVLILGLRFSAPVIFQFLKVTQKAGVRVLSIPEGAQVFLDNQEVGKTPYEDTELLEREYTIKIQAAEASWQGRVKLNGSTLTVINRELSSEISSSAGEVLTLDKGMGLTLISSPSDADIEIDGHNFEKTPKFIPLDPGEHTIYLSHLGYLKRSIKVYIPEKYNLIVSVDLALSEADLSNISTPTITETPKVVVKNTVSPNPGFLRVRDKPSSLGKEIARVLPGEELILLEELSGWDKVRLSNGSEGYVSKTYVEKKTQ